jgi:hypothetical protein
MLHAIPLLLAMLVAMTTQELPKGQFPAGWTVRVDGAAGHAGHGTPTASAPSAKDVTFVVMQPGWHITTGPSVILFDPNVKAAGAYTVKSETFLFDPGTRREAYGVLIGGRNLETDDQAYTYFVIRRSGEFLIRRRAGSTTTNVRDWSAAPAIRKFDDKRPDERSVRNVLEIKVAADTTAFLVNGTEVARAPTRDIDTDGIVGLRVNHQLNIHVSSLDVVK